MEIVTNDTSDIRAQATALIEKVGHDGTVSTIGTAVHIGAGVYLTAAHVIFDPENPNCVREADAFRVTVGASLDTQASFQIDAQLPPDTAPSQCTFLTGSSNNAPFHHFGWASPGGTDIAVIFGEDVGAPAMNLWNKVQPKSFVQQIESFGFPNGAGFDGRTMVHTEGQFGSSGAPPGDGPYRIIDTPDGPVSVLVSEPGMAFLPGQDGAGVFGAFSGEEFSRIETWLFGISTLETSSDPAAPSTGIEPIAEIYVELANLLEGRGYDKDDLRVAYLDFFDQHTPPSDLVLTGTFLNETFDARQGPATIDGGGGDDIILAADDSEVVFGGLGNDTISGLTDVMYGGDGDDLLVGGDEIYGGNGRDQIYGNGSARLVDGDGVDLLFGENGKSVFDTFDPKADTFVMVADGRPDDIRVFEKEYDQIDISAWGVTSFDQLDISDHRSGRVYLEFGNERLLIDDGERRLDAADMTSDMFIFTPEHSSLLNIFGTAADDRLVGTDANERLIDGGGVDVMFGGGGSDRFYLMHDSQVDHIKDFQDGIDIIDISFWAGATGLDKLAISDIGNGKVRINWYTETLIVMDQHRSLQAVDLTAQDFFFSAPQNLTFIGTDADDKIYASPFDDVIIDLGGVDAMFGRDGADHFVLSADGQIDFIKDFQDGLDLIDIGRWEGAEFEDLSLRAIKTGKVLVTYGNEELVVQDVARTLTVQDLTTEDFTADPTAGIFQ